MNAQVALSASGIANRIYTTAKERQLIAAFWTAEFAGENHLQVGWHFYHAESGLLATGHIGLSNEEALDYLERR